MSNYRNNHLKHLLVLGTLLIAGLLLYSTVTKFSQSESANQENETDGDKGKKKKKPLPDFLTRTPVLLPGIFQKQIASQDNDPDEPISDLTDRMFSDLSNSALRMNRAKAGHWYSANYPVIANHINVEGELTTQTVLPTGKPVPVPHTHYWPVHKRPVALAKQEWKHLESSVYVPVRTDLRGDAPTVLVSFSIDQRNAALMQASTIQPILSMKAFQYHFVVLSDRPDSWTSLKLTDSFQMSGTSDSGEARPPIYHLVPSIPGEPVPLSRNPLQWTTIAYVLWDNLPADALNPDQQAALIDWLHHGGQLIISGPDCLDRLRSSFLADYLPASFDGSINLTADEVTTLNEHWSIPSDRTDQRRELTLSPTRPISGVRFDPHPESRFVDGTGEVAIERQIGRGRIVMTSFSLMSSQVRRWRSFQSFLNGALLRKPVRKFDRNQNLQNEFTYETGFTYVNDSTSIYDPLLASTVRFLSRDLGSKGTEEKSDEVVEESVARPSGFRNRSDTWHYGGYQDQPTAGVGGWNDFSGISIAAKRALQESAGIKPPSAEFVLQMLGGYLLVLVPMNWLIFRSIGKVEYAWAAAPIIAIAGAIGVVRMASLDIGFVRSNTELGLLEVFADHPRAHLTQYSALYTSLTTRYTAELDNATSQALPLAVSKTSGYPNSNRQPFSTVNLIRSVQNRLEDFQVQSNSTGLLHTETMLDIDGQFSINSSNALTNSSSVALQATGVIRRSDDGEETSVAWIGGLEPGQTVDLEFKPTGENKHYQAWLISPRLASVTRQARAIWNSNVAEDRTVASRSTLLSFPELQNDLAEYKRLTKLAQKTVGEQGFSYDDFREIYVTAQSAENESNENQGAGDLFDAVTRNLTLGPGEVRLLGVTDQALSLGKLNPEATQTRRQTLVVVHLSNPRLPPARRDLNAYQDKANLSDIDLEEEAKVLEQTFDERIDP